MNYSVDTLDNGARVVHVPMRGNPAVTVMALVGAGSEYENKDEGGMAHFLEHMLFKGTVKRPKGIDLSRELDEIGAAYNAGTSREYTAYYVKAARVHLKKVTDILADMVLNSTLSEDSIDRERGVVLEEINMYRDLPQERVAELFTELIFGDQPAGRDIIGTRESVSSFKHDDFVSFRQRHYAAENTVVVIAGGIPHKKALVAAQTLFADLKRGDRAEKPAFKRYVPASRVVCEYKQTDQTHLVIGGESCHRYHDDIWPLEVLQSILDGGMSSRIFQRIREELGAAYYAGFGTSAYRDHGVWTFGAGVATERTEEVIRAALEEFEKVRKGEVDESELKKAKDHLVGSILLSLETSSSLARFYGFQVIFDEDPIYTPEDVRERIQAVTAEEVERVAKAYLAPESMHLAVVGPHQDKAMFERILS